MTFSRPVTVVNSWSSLISENRSSRIDRMMDEVMYIYIYPTLLWVFYLRKGLTEPPCPFRSSFFAHPHWGWTEMFLCKDKKRKWQSRLGYTCIFYSLSALKLLPVVARRGEIWSSCRSSPSGVYRQHGGNRNVIISQKFCAVFPVSRGR